MKFKKHRNLLYSTGIILLFSCSSCCVGRPEGNRPRHERHGWQHHHHGEMMPHPHKP